MGVMGDFSMKDYKSENITEKIKHSAKELFEIETLKPFQLLVIQRILEQDSSSFVRHQLVILPTGTGKSLCFLLPAVLCEGLTIIVYPLLALMNDQKTKLEKAGIDCIILRGGQTKEQRQKIWHKLKMLSSATNTPKTKIVMTTPETLLQPRVIKELKQYKISLLVVDEAHVIEQWGKDFRPHYAKLKEVVTKLMPKQVLAFTATASKNTIQTINEHLFPSKPLVIQGDIDRENIIYAVYPTLDLNHATVDIIESCQKPAIIFCRTRHETHQLCYEITRDLYKRAINGNSKNALQTLPQIRYYHAGLSRNEREKLEKWFSITKDGVLVTTCAFGMGVDVKSIRTVIHHRLPNSFEEYLQESGRAGRDGKTSIAWVLKEPNPMQQNYEIMAPKSKLIENLMQENTDIKDNVTRNNIPTLEEVFEQNKCRRQGLLNGMGLDKLECTGCDVCFEKVIKNSSEEIILKDFTKMFAFRYSLEKAAYILTGNCDTSVVNNSDMLNPFFGILKNWNCTKLKEALRKICKDGRCSIKYVSFAKKGKLLYRCDISLYNFISEVLGRLNDGYFWIIRQRSKFKRSISKIGNFGKTAH